MYSVKGNKQVGQILFDVAQYLNEKKASPKLYEITLTKCPDANARITFQLSANVLEQKGLDQISHGSMGSVSILPNMAGDSSMISMGGPVSLLSPPTPEPPMRLPPRPTDDNTPQPSIASTKEKIAYYQNQIRRLKQKVDDRQEIQNKVDELKGKIKTDDFASIKQLKKSLQASRKETEKFNSIALKEAQVAQQLRDIEDELCRRKVQIMTAFNYASQSRGAQTVNDMQELCGI